MAELAFTRCGAGAPMVLLHGIGSLRGVWSPVVPALAERFDVIAVDLPGFGDSPPLPPQVEPTAAALAARVARFLDELGVTTPHLVGNSLGGWVALELAAQRPVASLALLSPAGLWRGRNPIYNRISLRVTRWLSRHATGPLCHLMAYRLPRILVLGQTHGRPTRIDPEYARMEIRAFGACPGFDATMKALRSRHYRAESPLDAPLTVTFSSRDLLLLPHAAAMITLRADGTPHAVRCGIALVEGKLWSSGVPQRVRTQHLRRDPRATLFVFGNEPADRYSYLTLECSVTILEGPDAAEFNRRLFTVMQAGMERPPGTLFWEGTPRSEDEFVQVMTDEQRLIYEFEVNRSYGMF